MIRPGEEWLDTDGRAIQAHGGGILRAGDLWYWYGENKEGPTGPGGCGARVDVIGISCYSSANLVAWKNEGLVLKASDDPASDLHPSKVVERPKVAFNAVTGKFVMWMHIDVNDYSAARAGVAVSDTPTGPFRYLGSLRPDDSESRDLTLLVDDDGSGYLIYSSENNKTAHLSLLTDDYLRPSGKWERLFIRRSMEAHAVFTASNRYWYVASGCTGWKPNAARSAVADSIWGPWEELGSPCLGKEAGRSFRSQGTFVLPLDGGALFMADRWVKEDLRTSSYVWLPIRMEEGRFEIEWHNAWDPSNLLRG